MIYTCITKGKLTATRCFLRVKMHTNAFSFGAPPQTPLEKLTELPRPLAELRRGRNGGTGKEREREKRASVAEGQEKRMQRMTLFH